VHQSLAVFLASHHQDKNTPQMSTLKMYGTKRKPKISQSDTSQLT